MNIFESISSAFKPKEPKEQGVALVRAGSLRSRNQDDEIDSWSHARKQLMFLKYYEQVPLVHQIVDVQVDQVVQDFYFEGPNSESLKKFSDEQNIQTFLYRITKNLLIFGNAYCEVVKEGEDIGQLKILNPEWMQVFRTPMGKIQGYSQSINGKKILLWGTTGETREDETYPKRIAKIQSIVHFKFNVLASDKYGRSVIEPLVGTIQSKMSMEGNLGKLLGKYVAPLIWAKVGSDEMPAQASAVTDVAATLRNLHAESEIATTHLVDLQVLDFNSKGMDIKTPLQQIENQIITGGGVPEILLSRGGTAGVDKAAEVQLRSFTRHIKSIQRELKEEFEDKIIVGQGLGSDEDKLVWNRVEEREWEIETDILRGLVTDGVITPQKANDLLPPKFQEKLPDMVALLNQQSQAGGVQKPRPSQGSNDKVKMNPHNPTMTTKIPNAQGKRNIKTERKIPV
jgi:hypothetical protein